jgi:ribosome maturation factor RimP
VKVVLLDGNEISGRIKSSDQESAQVDDKSIIFSQVKRATLEVEFKQVKK